MIHNITLKKHFALSLLSTAALSSLSLSSCQDYDAGITEESLSKLKYKDEFTKAFGKIDPNHDWGFGKSLANGTRAVNTNSNEWESVFHYVVPGGVAKTNAEYIDNGNSWTSSDVTNEERRYVYWWFSTHRNPTPLEVNWDSYFMQNVWGQPEHSGQYVIYGDCTKNNQTKPTTMDYGMDALEVQDPSKPSTNPYSSDPYYIEHINDFNAGGNMKEQIMYMYNTSTKDFSYNSSRSSNRYHRFTMQYINGNYYLAFDCESHKCSDPAHCEHDIDCYKLGYNEHGELTPGGDRCKHRSGDPCLVADGFYNDWILKLGAGIRKSGSTNTKRVMCEDLGGTFDFDFDDIVFDVSPAPNNGLEITLQAAGGTLPVYLCDTDDNHEIHKMLGLNKLEPINVELNGHHRPVSVMYLTSDQADALHIGYDTKSVTYQVGKEDGTLENKTEDIRIYHAQDIPIYVKKTKPATDIDSETTELKRLEVYKGEAPDKFGCKNSTKWMIERSHITRGYTNFEDWVKAATTEWEETIRDPDLLYPYAGSGSTNSGAYRPNDYNDGVPSHGDNIVAWSTLCNEIDWANWMTNVSGNKTDLGVDRGEFFSVQRPDYMPLSSPFLQDAFAPMSLEVGSALNIYSIVQRSVVDTDITLEKVSGDDIINLTTHEIENIGTEYIKLTYTGSSFANTSITIQINGTLKSPFSVNNPSITIENGGTFSLSDYIADGLTSTDFEITCPSIVSYSDGVFTVSGSPAANGSITITYIGSGNYSTSPLIINVTIAKESPYLVSSPSSKTVSAGSTFNVSEFIKSDAGNNYSVQLQDLHWDTSGKAELEYNNGTFTAIRATTQGPVTIAISYNEMNSNYQNGELLFVKVTVTE